MTSHPMPPSVAERLLRLSVRDPEWRDAVLGDLREELLGVAARRGPAAARRWYWRQALPLAARFTAGRLIPAVTPPRRGTVVADLEAVSLGSGWLREFRHALRALRQRPGHTAIIVVMLAVALAANAVIFNLADALYLRPFRFPGVEQLAIVIAGRDTAQPFIDRTSVTAADLREWRADTTTMAALAAAAWWDPNLSGVDQPEQLAGFRVSPEFFRVLGVHAAVGRVFGGDDATPGNHRRAILSHAFWNRRFGADPAVVGRTIRLDGETYDVVGVMPPRFAIPYGAEVWAPLSLDDAEWSDRKRAWLMIFGRLADGRTLADAQAEFAAFGERQAARYPDTNSERQVAVMGFTRGMADEGAGPFLAILQAAAALLLLVACANVANLLLARGTEREPEFAVRLALGASRPRLVLQLLIEGGCLALLALAVAIPLAAAGVTLSRDFLPPSVLRFVPGFEFLRLDWAVLSVMALLGGLATVTFSLVPALQASRAAVAGSLRQSTRTTTSSQGRQWTRSALASAQVAITLALVVASGLILGGVDRAVNGAIGFDRRGVITAVLTLPAKQYDTPERRRQFVDGVLGRLRGHPGVVDAGAVGSLPYGTNSASRPFYPEGVTLTPAEVRNVGYSRATPGYLQALRIPLLAGRDLAPTDGETSTPVALVTPALVARYWPGRDPIGRRFRIEPEGPWIEVVGVAGDVVQDWVSATRRPAVYVPMTQAPAFDMAIVARATGDPSLLAADLRRAIHAVDPDQPILLLRTMDEVVEDRVAGVSYLASMLTVMSALALVLSLMGMYSLMAFLAARRTQEIGLRLALGATRQQVIGLTTRHAGLVTAVGIATGTALAILVGRVMESALFGLTSPNGALLAAVVAVLSLVALAAGYLPARRAARLDPWQALRTE